MTAPTTTWSARFTQIQRPTIKGILQSFVALTHNGMALLGLALAFTVVLFISRPDLLQTTESVVYNWLEQRQASTLDEQPISDPTAIDRVTAADPSDLPKAQAQVAQWLSRKYNVAPEPLSALVSEAYVVGSQTRLDPTLILAVMAIESRFNPFAASPVGAQGLMQVMTRVHTDKYEGFGGRMAAFDPVSNLRVGAQVLKDAVRNAGSVEGGLRLYVGAVSTDGQDYVDKVLSEHDRLTRVAHGQRVAFTAHQRNSPPPTASTADTPAAAPVSDELPATPVALTAPSRTS